LHNFWDEDKPNVPNKTKTEMADNLMFLIVYKMSTLPTCNDD